MEVIYKKALAGLIHNEKAAEHFLFRDYDCRIFYDVNPRGWSRLRYAIGGEWNITKRIVIEGYYLRQNTWASVPQFVNATGLAVQFYLR